MDWALFFSAGILYVIAVYWLVRRDEKRTQARLRPVRAKIRCGCDNCGWVEYLDREYGLSRVGKEYECPLCGFTGIIRVTEREAGK
jgi:predicted RNA-binding Zn-ribbon protein involved in translation (DUF1610 family)